MRGDLLTGLMVGLLIGDIDVVEDPDLFLSSDGPPLPLPDLADELDFIKENL